MQYSFYNFCWQSGTPGTPGWHIMNLLSGPINVRMAVLVTAVLVYAIRTLLNNLRKAFCRYWMSFNIDTLLYITSYETGIYTQSARSICGDKKPVPNVNYSASKTGYACLALYTVSGCLQQMVADVLFISCYNYFCFDHETNENNQPIFVIRISHALIRLGFIHTKPWF